ncbi:hypothetical protein [uncultured Psychromonas sp.]|uniref:hypothetical protein n=1 Tax=uncultured Psychromonas sp. TaxID=173974 RepID=UPI0026149C5F|nr:hypothetical protein [uncultured Psychromonas sp.]
MSVKWENNQCPQSLISDIKTYFFINEDGNVGTKSGVEFQIDTLFSKVKHKYDLDYSVLYKIFKNAVTSAFKSNNLAKPDNVLSVFKSKCDDSLKIKNKYYLLTSINLKNVSVLKRRTINGCVISFYKDIPNKYKKSRSELMHKHRKESFTEQPHYLFVSISVIAPDVKTAFKNAIGALDTLRAILQLNFSKSIPHFSFREEEKYSSDSILSLGQVHSLHLESGACACINVWYEPNLKCKTSIEIDNFELTEATLTRTLKKLSHNPFSEHLFDSLQSYIVAIDHSEQEFRFMKLWSVIEKLVKSDDTKIIIKRVSFLYENRGVIKEVLNSLRQARNINVHSGIKPLNVEMKNFNLCSYIEDLFKFFIENPFNYNKLQMVIDFISLPTDLQGIDQQIKNLKTVKKFIGAV